MISLAFLGSGYCCASRASETVCIDEAEYQRLSKSYADLLAKFDLLPIAQELLDVGSAAEDLKEQVNDCRKDAGDADERRCDPLVKQYSEKRTEQDTLITRFNAATDTQQYLLTLKLKLERPRCGK